MKIYTGKKTKLGHWTTRNARGGIVELIGLDTTLIRRVGISSDMYAFINEVSYDTNLKVYTQFLFPFRSQVIAIKDLDEGTLFHWSVLDLIITVIIVLIWNSLIFGLLAYFFAGFNSILGLLIGAPCWLSPILLIRAYLIAKKDL